MVGVRVRRRVAVVTDGLTEGRPRKFNGKDARAAVAQRGLEALQPPQFGAVAALRGGAIRDREAAGEEGKDLGAEGEEEVLAPANTGALVGPVELEMSPVDGREPVEDVIDVDTVRAQVHTCGEERLVACLLRKEQDRKGPSVEDFHGGVFPLVPLLQGCGVQGGDVGQSASP